MSTFSSPLKLTASQAKIRRMSNQWNLCIICQVSTVEKLSSLSTKGQQTVLDAVNTRKDDVFRRLHDEYSSLADVDIERLCYHKSCYKSYTSRVNLEKFVMPDVNNLKDTSNANQPCCSHPVQTRSMFTPFDWTTCISTQKGQGRSNIVFSSSISIAEAIQAASHLKCELKLSEIEAEVEIGPINEDQTLHAAASIIRRQLQSLDISNETYPTPSEISLSYSTQHTPCLLTKFLLWIIDDKSYNGEGEMVYAGCFHPYIKTQWVSRAFLFIATVGKLWASAGLSDLLVDSGIYASNTVDQMLVGKQFNRGVRD
ncbi:unnamed protein product [Mytilus edulis]|uniref:Uncharacterized protein n=1 Tax=Mytilus edulis TaxID=6550 RepID=A0A8S3R382_MYTED|nr:unnamed protein product [Mytilus edulis]